MELGPCTPASTTKFDARHALPWNWAHNSAHELQPPNSEQAKHSLEAGPTSWAHELVAPNSGQAKHPLGAWPTNRVHQLGPQAGPTSLWHQFSKRMHHSLILKKELGP